MKVTAVVGTKFGVDVHRAGCADLTRGRKAVSHGHETFEDVETMFAALLDTGDEGSPGWIREEFKFLPCTGEVVSNG